MVSRWLLGALFGALALGFVVVPATPSVSAGIAGVLLNKVEHDGSGIVRVHGTHTWCVYGPYDGRVGWHAYVGGTYVPCYEYTLRCPPLCNLRDIRWSCPRCPPPVCLTCPYLRLKRDQVILPGDYRTIVLPEVIGQRAFRLQRSYDPQPDPWSILKGPAGQVSK